MLHYRDTGPLKCCFTAGQHRTYFDLNRRGRRTVSGNAMQCNAMQMILTLPEKTIPIKGKIGVNVAILKISLARPAGTADLNIFLGPRR